MTARLSTHVFQSDGITDPVALKPVEYCTCGLPKRHPIHELAPQTAEQDAADAARLGEHDDKETL